MHPRDRIAALVERWPWLNELGDQASGVATAWSPLPREVSFLVRHRAFACRPTVHRRAQLVIAVAGSGEMAVDRGRFRLDPGDAVLVAPFQSHHYPRFFAKEICWLFLHWIEEEPEHLSSLRDRCPHLDEACWQRLEGFAAAADAFLGGDRDRGGECDCWLALLLCALRRTAGAAAGRIGAADGRASDLVRRCRGLVADWIERPFTLADLAHELGVSEIHLRRAYRQASAGSLGNLVRSCRMERARHLLERGDQPVAEVARASGFASLPAFSRAFRVAHGISPSGWRRGWQGRTTE